MTMRLAQPVDGQAPHGEVISYDSDDEMVRSSRRSGGFGSSRTKKGHPIYSREDIREQYCINRKELCVFEDGAYQENRLFGCLSTSHLPDHSPCNKNTSFLLSCVQKRKSSIDLEKRPVTSTAKADQASRVDEDEDSDGGFKRRPKPRTCLMAEQRYTWAVDSRICSQETLDSGPYYGHQEPRYYAQPYVHPQEQFAYGARIPYVAPITSRAPLHGTRSLGYPNESELALAAMASPSASYALAGHPHRPSQLRFDGAPREPPMLYSKTSHSVDELNGKSGATDDWYHAAGSGGQARSAKTPDLLQSEDGRQKHVSFDTTLVRSNTIGGGLEGDSPSLQAYPISFGESDGRGTCIGSPPRRNQSQERLIMGAQAERSMSSLRSLDLQSMPLMGSAALGPVMMPAMASTCTQANYAASFYASPAYAPALRVIRRAVMKTQATQTPQTEAASAAAASNSTSSNAVRTKQHRNSIPAYLTLSPRASAQAHRQRSARTSSNYHYNRHPLYQQSRSTVNVESAGTAAAGHHASGQQTGSAKSKANQQHGPLGVTRHSEDSDDEDEVMEVHLKEPKGRKTHSRPDSARQLQMQGSELGENGSEKQPRVRMRQRVKPHKSERDVMTPRANQAHYAGDDSREQEKNSQSSVGSHPPLSTLKAHSADALEELDTSTSPHGEGDDVEDLREVRRHSVGGSLCAQGTSFGNQHSAFLYNPPPGFEDARGAEAGLDGQKADVEAFVERASSSSATSSESSKAQCSGLTDNDAPSTGGGASELEELESSLQGSHDSPTLVSDLSNTVGEATFSLGAKPAVVFKAPDVTKDTHATHTPRQGSLERDPVEPTNVTRRPLVVDPDLVAQSSHRRLVRDATFDASGQLGPDVLNSPESESSSHLTELISSASTTGSGPPGDEKGSGSSVYVTATEHSPTASRGKTCSFETASSAAASLFSSPASSGKRKSSSSGPEGEGATSPEYAESKSSKGSIPSPGRIHLLTSPGKQGRVFFHDENKSESSEDSSTRREKAGSPGSESASKSFEFLDEFDSEGLGDTTPIYELYSSDPSTAFEPTTIVENVPDLISISKEVSQIVSSAVCAASAIVQSREASAASTPEVPQSKLEAQSSEEGNESTTETVVLHSSSAPAVDQSAGAAVRDEVVETIETDDLERFASEEKIDDLALSGAIFCRRTLSGELSTVSEVSEEMSNHKSTNASLSSTASSSGSSSKSADRKGQRDLDERSKPGEIRGDSVGEQKVDHDANEDDSPIERDASGHSSPSLAESTSGSFALDDEHHSQDSGHSASEESKRESSTIERTTASLPGASTEESIQTHTKESEGTPGSFKLLEESKTEITSEKVSGEPLPKDFVVAAVADVESSQATERDVARSEFSLEQQSSQEIDEESLSLGAQSVSHALPEQLSADIESSSTGTPLQPPSLSNKPPLMPKPILHRLTHAPGALQATASSAPTSLGATFSQSASSAGGAHPFGGSRQLMRQSLAQQDSSSDSSVQRRVEAFQRRTQSLNKSPEKVPIDQPQATAPQVAAQQAHVHRCSHRLTCSHCDETNQREQQARASIGMQQSLLQRKDSAPQAMPPPLTLKSRQPYPYKRASTVDDIYTEPTEEEEDTGVYSDSYLSELWFYIGRKEELAVWGQKLIGADSKALVRSDSLESTVSEKGFRKQFEAVTHRMIHRKASIEMYRRLLNKSLGTPAESCGLEVGDIIVKLNDVDVLEASHSEIVRLAHSGAETLHIELVRTRNALDKTPSQEQSVAETSAAESTRLMSGFLQRKTSCEDKGWRKRWYLLKTDYCLYWYKSPKDTDPLGAIRLNNCCASLDVELSRESCFPFRLTREGSSATHVAAAPDAETALRWVTALNDAVNKQSQSDPYLELSLRNVKHTPISIRDGDAYGFLGKFSQKRKTWKQCYFVLKDACLYFYVDITSTVALGVIYLQGYKVQSCSMVAKKNTFELIPPQTKFKHFWFMAESEVDKKRWLAALEYSIDRWLKLSSL